MFSLGLQWAGLIWAGTKMGQDSNGLGLDRAGLFSPGLKWAWTRMAELNWAGLDRAGLVWEDTLLFSFLFAFLNKKLGYLMRMLLEVHHRYVSKNTKGYITEHKFRKNPNERLALRRALG